MSKVYTSIIGVGVMFEDCFGSIPVANQISFQKDSDFLLFCTFSESQLAGWWEISIIHLMDFNREIR